jgi:hypothetical protein
LVRLNDWIEVIRAQAEACVVALTEDDVAAVVASLALVLRIEGQQRRSRRALDHLYRLLASPGGRDELRVAWSHPDYRVRRAAYRLSLEFGGDLSEVIAAAAEDADPLLQRWAVGIMPGLPDPKGGELLRSAVRSRHAGVRVAALDGLEALLAPDDEGLLESAAFDPHAGVQLTARYLLQKHFGARDFAASYRTRLDDRDRRRQLAAVVRLAAVGKPADAQLILDVSRNGRPRLRRAGLSAAATLDFESTRPELLKALGSEVPGVSSQARQLLSRRMLSTDQEYLAAVAAESEHAHVRRNAVMLAARLRGWVCLPILLIGCDDPDASVATTSTELLEPLLQTFLHASYRPTPPSKHELERAEAAFEQSGSKLPDDIRQNLLRVLEGARP